MKSNILGVKVDAVNMDGALSKIEQYILSGRPHHVITLNAEILYTAQDDPALLEIINSAHLVTPDGAGIVWAAKHLGQPVPERVTGIDLMLHLMSRAEERGWRVFLYGAAPGVAEEAAAKLMEKHPELKIVGISHGYLDDEGEVKLRQEVRDAEPHVLLAALGAPKQEYWIQEHLGALSVPVNMGVGGSFDVIAGRVRRAPLWMQRARLEWLYRLIQEPKRYKRMLNLPKFMLAVYKEGKS